MPNFPSKWFDFINQKELKRLRKDINKNHWSKIQIATSIIIAICTLIFADSIKTLCLGGKIGVFVGLSSVVILVFMMPWIIKRISLLRVNNQLIDGKTATSIFDEEIVYNILVANEFFEIYTSNTKCTLANELENFYEIEIEYYVKCAIEKLISFNTNIPGIVGDKKNQISIKRVKNITAMIDALIKAMNIKFDEFLGDYEKLKNNI